MSIEHQRPGVYSSYDASSVVYGGSGGQTVGIAARAVSGTPATLTRFSSAAPALTLYGSDRSGGDLSALIELALANGAASVAAVPVSVGSESPAQEDYTAALELLAGEEDISLVLCDSTDPAVHQLLLTHAVTCSQHRRERLAVAAGGSDEGVEALVSRAKALNSPRFLLVAPSSTNADGTPLPDGCAAAAAVAGALAGETDPAVPLGGAVLTGLSGLSVSYSDGQLDALIAGGVIPLEASGGQVSVVRGITTCTASGGAPDRTWQEISTVRVADHVIPLVRSALRARFRRVKNTAVTRSAIGSQVVLILEDQVSRQIIDSYDSVSVRADTEDPTRCLVDFDFTVAHGLNQILLTAHITV